MIECAASEPASEARAERARAGLLTEAAASLPKLLEISRHKQIETLRHYLRPTDMFSNLAAKGLL